MSDSETEDPSPFSNEVLCLMMEYSCYKDERPLIQVLHRKFSEIKVEDSENLLYYTSAKKRFLIAGIEGYLSESDNPDVLQAMGSFEDLSKENYEEVYTQEGFCSVYKGLKIQSLLHYIRKDRIPIKKLENILKKLTKPLKIPKPVMAASSPVNVKNKYIKIVNQVEVDNKFISKRFGDFFKVFQQKSLSNAKKISSAQKLIKEFPYQQFKQQLQNFLRSLSKAIPLPLLEMIGRGIPIGHSKSIAIQPSSLAKVIPTEEVISIHNGSDRKLKKWIHDNNMTDKLIFMKPRQSPYLSYLQHFKPNEPITEKLSSPKKKRNPDEVINKLKETTDILTTMGGDDPLDEALTQINNKKKQTNLKRKLSVAKTPQSKRAKHGESLSEHDETLTDSSFEIPNLKTPKIVRHQIEDSESDQEMYSDSEEEEKEKEITKNKQNQKFVKSKEETPKKQTKSIEKAKEKQTTTIKQPTKQVKGNKNTFSQPSGRVGVTTLGQRKRRKWTDSEVETLMEGVRLLGSGNWKSIMNAFDFGDRTCVDLKDKFRNLKKRYTLEEIYGTDTMEQENAKDED